MRDLRSRRFACGSAGLFAGVAIVGVGIGSAPLALIESILCGLVVGVAMHHVRAGRM